MKIKQERFELEEEISKMEGERLEVTRERASVQQRRYAVEELAAVRAKNHPLPHNLGCFTHNFAVSRSFRTYRACTLYRSLSAVVVRCPNAR